jgi:hypothetical protein
VFYGFVFALDCVAYLVLGDYHQVAAVLLLDGPFLEIIFGILLAGWYSIFVTLGKLSCLISVDVITNLFLRL